MLGDSAATSREGNLTDLGAIAEYNQQLMQAVQAAPVGQVDPELRRLVQASVAALELACRRGERIGIIPARTGPSVPQRSPPFERELEEA